jgi:hypothetical protein
MDSRYLNKRAIKGLNRIGDILIPGQGDFPSFSAYQCVEHIDDLVEFAPSADIKDLGLVLSMLSFLPAITLKWLVNKMASAHKDDSILGSLFRQLNMGIRGIVFSLYYSAKPGTKYHGMNPTEMVGFKVNKVI